MGEEINPFVPDVCQMLLNVVLLISVLAPDLANSAPWWSSSSIPKSPSSSSSEYSAHNIQSSASSSTSSLAITSQASSVHRFSNLYGTVLSCSDYLFSTFNGHQVLTIDGVQLNLQTFLHRYYYLNSNKDHQSSHSSNDLNSNHHYRQRPTNINYYDDLLATNSANTDNFNVTITWEVRSVFPNSYHNGYHQGSSSSRGKSSASSTSLSSFEQAYDRANLRYSNVRDGSLSFAPFESDSFVPDIHDAFYRCLLHLPQGVLASREVRVQSVVEKSTQTQSNDLSRTSKRSEINSDIGDSETTNSGSSTTLYVRTLNSSEVSDGNDAILKCSFDRQNSLYEVCAWLRDDGKIYLPLDSLIRSMQRTLRMSTSGSSSSSSSGSSVGSNQAFSNSFNNNYVNYTAFRHLILPGSGDLLISNVHSRDAKHRYRCQVRHTITNERHLASTYGQIRLKENSELYLSGPRLNPQLQTRHTLAVNEGESVFFYCSFDGHPSPVIDWYHTDLKSLTHKPTLSSLHSRSFSGSTLSLSVPTQRKDQFNPFLLWSSPIGSSSGASASNNAINNNNNDKPINYQQYASADSSGSYLFGKNFLAIEKVSDVDTGIVSCVANNSNSIVRHEMLLFVKDSIQVNLYSSSIKPYPGEDITLSCNLSTSSAYVPLQFNSMPNGAFQSSSSSSSLSSSSSSSSSQSSSSLPDHQQTEVEIQSKRLRELISSHFLLNINWYHNGKLINFDHRIRRSAEDQLLIRDFRGPEDNGMYQCSTRLTAPDYDEESFMSALYIQSIEKAPELTSVFTDQINLVDRRPEPVSLKCSAEGVPLPRIRWFLDGVELYSSNHVRIESFADTGNSDGLSQLSSSSSSSASSSGPNKMTHLTRSISSHLNISSLLLQDIGMYECVAENYLGSAVHRARINQMGPPFVKPIGNQTAVLGQPFTINCTYGGYPLEEVYFIKSSADLGSSSNKPPLSSSRSNNNNNNNKRMPFDERHLVPMLGSITINPVEKSDQDYYHCVVVTSNGERAEQKFYLNVVVGPVISPIVFSDNLEEGMRGSAVCTVTSGDPPIQIAWFKDGVQLREQSLLPPSSHRSSHITSKHDTSSSDYLVNHIQIVSIKDFMSSLIIGNISRHHQGTYTCVASSPIATTNVSAYLSVRAKPLWRLRPSDQNQVAGDSLTLNCQTSGQPPPVIRWKFLKNEPYHSEPIPILSSQQVHVLENGSLYLRALEPKHSGIYICDASNGVNKNTIESRAHITISNLPKVSIQNTLGKSGNGPGSVGNSGATITGSSYRGNNVERLVLRKGVQTQLLCTAIGIDTPMTAKWLRPNGRNGDSNGDDISDDIHNGQTRNKKESNFAESRIVLREESKLNEKRAFLFISHVIRSDSGIYSCLATNVNGHSVAFIELIIQEQPDVPVNLVAQEISSRTVVLTWSIGFNGNLPITSYVVEYRERSLPLTTASKTAAAASNNGGTMETSENDITNNNGNSNELNSNSVLTAKSLTTSITITGLNPLSTYEFRICAYNELGASPFTDLLTLTTEMEAPSLIPQELRTLVLNSRSIKLIWSALMTHPVERIDGFYIGYRPIHGPNEILVDSLLLKQSNTKSILASSSDQSSSMPSYTFKTMYDLSKYSTNGLNQTQSGSSSKFDKNDDNSNNNNNITTFCEVISVDEDPGDNSLPPPMLMNNDFLYGHSKLDMRMKYGSGHRPSDINGNRNTKLEQIRCTYEFLLASLSRKTKYGFIVQAFNAKGAGPTSQEVYAQTLMKDPPGKSYVRLINISSYEASIFWNVEQLQLQLDPNKMTDGFNQDSQDSLDTPEQQSGQQSIDGFIISYKVLKKFVFDPYNGNSNNNDQLNVMALDSKKQFNSKSTNNNNNNWETLTVSKKLSGYTLRNLRCGTNYRLRVEAFNEMGSGEASAILEFSTLGRAPISPNNNAFISTNISFVMLDLDRWNDDLCPISHFSLRYRIKDFSKSGHLSDSVGGNSILNENPLTQWITVSTHIKPEYGSMYVIRELMPATWYELSVTANNEAGETESRYLFATLTMAGATVEPLLALDGYNRHHLGSMIGGVLSSDSLFEDPMILIPATCAILVLLVVGAATAFIFIARSKERMTTSEPHFCRHRDNSRSDQLSLNSFSKNYSKSDLMRSYDVDSHKLTQIETLNCGQNDLLASNVVNQSQYVDGPVAYLESKITDEPNLIEPQVGTPRTRRNPGAVSSQPKPQESFYSTPCIPQQQQQQHLEAVKAQYNLEKISPYITQTLRKGQGGVIPTTSSNNNNEPRSSEFIYGDLMGCAQMSQQQQQQQQYHHHNYFIQPHPLNHHHHLEQSQQHPNNNSNNKTLSRDSNHIYELPKQQLQQQQQSNLISSQDSNMMMMTPMDTSNTQNQMILQKQSPHKNMNRSEPIVPNLRSFKQPNF